MVEAELESLPVEPPNRARFSWLLALFVFPRRTLQKILDLERPAWLLPLLVLSLLSIGHVLVAGPLRQAAAQNGMAELPEEFQWYSDDQKAQLMAAREAASGPMFTHLFPGMAGLGGVWVGWFLLGSLLHLSLTLGGSRSSSAAALNLAAWAAVPLGLRFIVQIIAMLVTGQLVASPGLSGFISAESGAAAFLASALALVDGYFLWQVALLLVGARPISGLPRGKAWMLTLLVVLLLLALQALPGYLGYRFSDMQMVRPFFF